MTAPELSIVVVTWNARDYALRCLDSLAHVTASCEVILVDDASTDGTADAVGARHPNVRVIRKPANEGLAAGRNSALPLIRGRLVLMLDADTEVRPGSVETMCRVLDAHPEVGLVGPKLVSPAGEIQDSCRRFPPLLLPFLRRGPIARLNPNPGAHRRHLMHDWDHATRRPVVWVIGAAQMWRADLPRLIGSYDTRISSYGGEDLDWCLRVWRAGYEVHYVPDATLTHVWQKVTRRSLYGRKSLRALRDFYYIQWKHRSLRGAPVLRGAEA